ncbi:MAG: type II/IV secretion system ATPase subunit [Methanomicrobiales archaeon]|nr:type II/IV secretion system ATPase subunit [Methanomicrobiales archaeon]
MLAHVLMIISLSITLIGISGFIATLKTCIYRTKDGLVTGADPCPPSCIDQEGELAGIGNTFRAFTERGLASFVAPTWAGIGYLSAIVLTAVITSIIALFIDLEIPLLAVLSIIAVLSCAISAIALRTRYEQNAWLPRTTEGSYAGAGAEARGPDEHFTPALADFAQPDTEIPLPESDDLSTGEELEWYWVEQPFSYIKIQQAGTEGYVYTVHEPAISAVEKTVLQETYAHLRDIIVYDTTEADSKDHFEPAVIHRIIRDFHPAIPDDRLAILTYYLRRNLSGYGLLEVLMRDPALEDLSCNGWDLPVFVFHKVYGNLPTNVLFQEGELNQFVLKLAQKANKQISLSNPMVDATLPDGARVQITYSDVVSTRGSSFTIRKFRADPMTPLDLIRLGTYSPQTLAFLWLAIEHHKSLLVVGGTASGKTSTMNAVSLFIPQNAKIVSLEDTREIQLPHKNWLPTQTRELNAEGVKGDIDLFSLLRACMRQRPEYIIVGEVRGREAQTLFQAMNTGHATLSTIHAGSVQEAINRLTHDPINVPPVMFQALDLVIVQSIYTLGKRRIRRNLSIHEIEVNGHGEILSLPLFEWEIRSDTFRQVSHKSRVLDEIATHCGWSQEDLTRELRKREEFFSRALALKNPTIRELANAIHDLGD